MSVEARGEIGLWLVVGFAVVALFLRAAYHRWRFGSTGLVGLRPGAPPLEVANGVALFAGLLALGGAAALQASGDLSPVDPLRGEGAAVAGLLLAGAGIAGTVWAQLAMGSSWRVGVDPAERTDLVTTGPFCWVRNPIFTSMLAFAVGLALLAPNVLSIAAAAVTLLAIEVQVRRVEEPYLGRTHGHGYAAWAERTGRFLPGLGRLLAR